MMLFLHSICYNFINVSYEYSSLNFCIKYRSIKSYRTGSINDLLTESSSTNFCFPRVIYFLNGYFLGLNRPPTPTYVYTSSTPYNYIEKQREYKLDWSYMIVWTCISSLRIKFMTLPMKLTTL